MLVLSRKKNEEVVITATNGERIYVTVQGIRGEIVRLGFNAPKDVEIHRSEIQEASESERPSGVRYDPNHPEGESYG